MKNSATILWWTTQHSPFTLNQVMVGGGNPVVLHLRKRGDPASSSKMGGRSIMEGSSANQSMKELISFIYSQIVVTAHRKFTDKINRYDY